MRYAELPLPPQLAGLVAAVWTMSVEGEGGWAEHEAVPDGCIELIRRHSGRSVWRDEQPPLFAAGLALSPAKLAFSPDASFTGIKLWPWAWHALGGAPCPGFADRWTAIPESSPLAALLPDAGDPIPRLLAANLQPNPLGTAILASTSVGEIGARSGLPHRQLQRVFARDLGLTPRAYLRLRRFRGAMIEVQASAATLADAAAGQGYADQAHMAREFRSLAGVAPREARARAKGPFL
ncbi:helix-turn-helix domain-containing protein [Sphingomonas sp. LB-2]|uniref:AraC family transcriptional regulator n=1 Tax=Sphingomonas caeni TaxID=2984949 RepID=UPI002232B02D|nr:AraC family transcriptional regulator [Sphingomonas caeni]MCW3846101.1 helix-turn-helix domain-containing protein [Sphingomonas caeni]